MKGERVLTYPIDWRNNTTPSGWWVMFPGQVNSFYRPNKLPPKLDMKLGYLKYNEHKGIGKCTT